MIVSLAVLALLDSTSIGTLFLPVLLMLAPGRPRTAPILGYLATIAVFYFALGIVLAFGAGPLFANVDERVGLWVQLVLGVALFVLSFRFDPKRRRAPVDWRARIEKAPWLLALTAGVLEAATMFPYLGAIALLAGAGIAPVGTAAALAGYCVVMILPALVLLAVRGRATRLLAKISRRNFAAATGWVLAVVGFLIARDAAFHLGFFDAWLDN